MSRAASPQPVTVAVVLFNGLDHLPHCLPAAGRLEGGVAEMLVVDNGSTDGGVDWVRRHHPGVRVVELEENRGPAAARNRALAESRTDRVLLLDCDVVAAPDCLRRLSDELDAHPECAIAQPRALFAGDPDRIHYDGAWFGYTGLMTLRNFGRSVRDADAEAIEVDAVISMALLVDRRRLEAVGPLGEPFDPLYFINFEDTDLSYRVRLAGGSLRLVPAATVRHRGGTPGVSYRAGTPLTFRRAFLLSRNRWLLLLKTYAWRTFWLTLPAQLAYEIVLFVFLAAKGQPHGWLAGKLDLARRCGAIRRRRREVQALRRVPDRRLLRFEGFSFVPLLAGGRLARAGGWMLEVVFRAYWKLVRWLI